jgi:hypothetical protein
MTQVYSIDEVGLFPPNTDLVGLGAITTRLVGEGTVEGTLSAGNDASVNVSVNTPLKSGTMFFTTFGLRVDTDNNTHLWPDGASLTAGQKNVNVNGPYLLLHETIPASGNYGFGFRFSNKDSITHTYYILVQIHIWYGRSGA